MGRTSKGIGIMFLNEVVLGKENHITVDDSSLVAPPSGYDSVVAKGHTEPGELTLKVPSSTDVQCVNSLNNMHSWFS